jgi:quinol monooxygenase YgiN
MTTRDGRHALGVVELRQYTLRPGQRGTLIELFDREFVDSQEAEGAHVLGQFRDLDRPDRFVWLRGFVDMASRHRALTAFYTGPVWKACGPAANATMLDVDNVLLLRPLAGFPLPANDPPAPASLVVATICLRERPFDEPFAAEFTSTIVPALTATGATPLAWLTTEYAENDYPALPVRTGEHAFVWLTRFATPAAYTAHAETRAGQPIWADLTTHELRLTPTPGSRLR